jgi:hypothetical protein
MATAINSGFRTEIVNLAVDDTAWTPLTFTDKTNNLLVRMRETSGELKISLDATGATYFTIPQGQSITIDWYAGKETPIYIQATVASATAEIFATFA